MVHRQPQRGDTGGLNHQALAQQFEHSPVPGFVARAASGRLLAVNAALCELTGYTADEMLATGFEGLARLFAATEGEDPPCTPADKRAMTLVRKDRGVVPVHLSVHFFRPGPADQPPGESMESAVADDDIQLPTDLAAGTVVDISRMHQLEAAVQQTRESARMQFEASVRVMQITQRTMKLPRLMEFMEAFEEPRFLIEGLCDFMTAPQGLEFAAAAIYRRSADGSRLELQHTIGSEPPAHLPMDADDPVARVAREEVPLYQGDDGYIAVPIALAGEVDGVLCVQYHPVTVRIIDDDQVIKETLFDLLVTVARLMGSRMENIRLLAQIREQTITDPLTKIYNRRFFENRLAEEFSRARRYGHALSLIMIDLDKFKDVNDTLGHQQGDSVLVEFCRICEETSREQDFICRMGGDEFAMILPNTPHWAAAVKAEKLRKKIDGHVFENIVTPGDPVKIWLSIGVAGFYDDMNDHEVFYHEADEVLYASKENGRNRVTVARPDQARKEAKDAQVRKDANKRTRTRA